MEHLILPEDGRPTPKRDRAFWWIMASVVVQAILLLLVLIALVNAVAETS